MSVIVESILPIFLLVLFGLVLKRWRVIDQGLWTGLEQFGYYVLFPALLFITLYRADFSGLSIGRVAIAGVGSILIFSLLLLLLWPILRRFGTAPGAFTTIFQTSIRWNGFVALAVAEKLYGTFGLGLVALVMALIIIPINLINVSVLLWFGSNTRGLGAFARRIVSNPLILGCVAGILMRFVPAGLYPPIAEAIDLIARSALGLSLLMVGAGLRIRDALLPRPAVILATVLKLLALPALMILLAVAMGIRDDTLLVLALCGAVPTAMNGYVLARQMGGDAPLYSAVATVQTALSFLTMPLVLAVAAQLISG